VEGGPKLIAIGGVAMVQLAADDAGNAEKNARYEKALQKYARYVRCPLRLRVKRLNTEW
jgi:hypothetical protein